MALTRPEHQRIDRYTGPYERWVYSDELGRPFAFPSIAGEPSGYFTALLEGGRRPPTGDGFETRLPPLWNPLNRRRAVTPFAFHDRGRNHPQRAQRQDRELAGLLGQMRDQACGTANTGDTGVAPRFRVNFPVATDSWVPGYDPEAPMSGWLPPATRPRAIIAVIDDAIPFAHRAFLGQDGRTRISHIWMQAARARAADSVPFGRQLTNGQIDALRADCGGDEVAIYRRAGALDAALPEQGLHLRRHATHGALVAGLAAGNDPRFANRLGDDIQIIAVQLPNTIAWDTSGFGKEMYMLAAINYCFARARDIARAYSNGDEPTELPVILNFSYGWSASRHDGQSEMELAIQELLEDRARIAPDVATALVMPTGNHFDADMHGQLTAADLSGGTARFGWQMQPDDKTSSYLEIWFPEGFDATGYSLHLTPPPGSTLDAPAAITFGHDPSLGTGPDAGDPRRFEDVSRNGAVVAQLSVDQHRSSRWRALVAMIPTTYTRGQSRRAPAGRWVVELRRNDAPPLPDEATVNIWVQRDDDPSSLRTGGRQSHLVELTAASGPPGQPARPNGDLGFLRGFGAMNGVASSALTVRVAGYVQATGQPCRYSGASGLRRASDHSTQAWGAPITVAAVADQSPARPGIPSTGVLSGSGSRLTGTSIAAPAVARQMVLNAAAGHDLWQGCTDWDEDPSDAAATLRQRARLGQRHAPVATRARL